MWDALIAAAGSLIGGGISQAGQRVANERASDQAANNIALQKEFAQTGVTWRARDAMRAYGETGIHPLILMGAPGATYSPQSTAFVPETGVGEGLHQAGQNIGRSIAASADRSLREKALALQESQMQSLAERGQLENEALRLRIASEKMRLAQMSMPGVPAVKSEQEIMFPGVENKIIPDVSVARTPRGGYVILPSKQAQERMEEIFGLGPEWWMRNRAWLATPEARDWARKYLPAAPSYKEWRYHAPTGEWLPHYQDYPDRHMQSDKRRDRLHMQYTPAPPLW